MNRPVINASTTTVKSLSEKEFNITRPTHYRDKGIEPIEYMRANFTPEQYEGFLVGNVIKYISRYKDKNGVDDLKKARWYIDRLIEGE